MENPPFVDDLPSYTVNLHCFGDFPAVRHVSWDRKNGIHLCGETRFFRPIRSSSKPWNISILKRKIIEKWAIFRSYVKLLESLVYSPTKIKKNSDFAACVWCQNSRQLNVWQSGTVEHDLNPGDFRSSCVFSPSGSPPTAVVLWIRGSGSGIWMFLNL